MAAHAHAIVQHPQHVGPQGHVARVAVAEEHHRPGLRVRHVPAVQPRAVGGREPGVLEVEPRRMPVPDRDNDWGRRPGTFSSFPKGPDEDSAGSGLGPGPTPFAATIRGSGSRRPRPGIDPSVRARASWPFGRPRRGFPPARREWIVDSASLGHKAIVDRATTCAACIMAASLRPRSESPLIPASFGASS